MEPAHGVATPLISVVVPTYNRAHLILSALDSIESQGCDSYEVLVVDDGSIDATADVIAMRAAANPKIRYVRNKHAKGVSGARNTGLELARGRYIAFLDSDDQWFPSHLAGAAALMERWPAIGFCFANRVWFDLESGAAMGEEFPSQRIFRKVEGSELGEGCYLLGGRLSQLFVPYNYVATPTVVLRAALLDGVRFDEDLALAEDRDFFLRFCLRGDIGIAFRDVAVARVARHAGNVSVRDAETNIRFAWAHIHLYEKLQANSSLDEWTRQRAQEQIANERTLIASYLRWSGRYREAWQHLRSTVGLLPMHRIGIEMLKVVGSWCGQTVGRMLPPRVHDRP